MHVELCMLSKRLTHAEFMTVVPFRSPRSSTRYRFLLSPNASRTVYR